MAATGRGVRRGGPRWWTVGAVAAALVLVGAGCGDDDDDDATAGEGGSTETTGASGTPGSTGTTAPPVGADDIDALAADEEAQDVSWQRNALDFRGRNGDVIGFECPPDGQPDSVWGTDVYTDDSSVCAAAVHVGLITVAEGGRVLIEIEPGVEEYTGTERNGIITYDYGPWEGSFTFPLA